MQQYLMLQEINFNAKSLSVFIPKKNDLLLGLKDEIKDIASGQNDVQLQIDLKACLESAFYLGSTKIYETLAKLSLGIAKTNQLEINQIINDLIKLGNKAWGTLEGYNKADILYSFCHDFGDKFTPIHIKNMVLREQSYSRVGVNALGILYTEFSKHIKSLDLSSVFDKESHPEVWYYCKLRERYIGASIFSIIANKATNYRIEDFFISPQDIDIMSSKYMNRGDSVLLDYIDKSKNA